MMSLAAPGLLWAGVVLAGVAVGLHLLTRRPPDALPLPTARFLRHQPRTLVRLRRWPADLPLLVVRVAFALCLGAAFAGPTWAPARSGSAHVILLEAGAGAAERWPDMVAVARAVAAPPAAGSTASEAPGEDVVVVAYGTDGGPTLLELRDPGALEALRPGTGPASFEDGLRALRSTLAGRTTLAEARVTWVARPVWEGWTPGVGLLRTALWPGAAAVRWVDGLDDGGDAGSLQPDGVGPATARPFVRVPGGATGLARALAALGVDVVDAEGVGPAGSATLTWTGSGSVPYGSVLMAGGASVAFPIEGSGTLPAPTGGAVGVGGASPAGESTVPGLPAAARVVAVAPTGGPVAWTWREDEGCRVHTSVPLETPAAAASGSFPRFLAGLLAACAAPAPGRRDLQPLDAGARAVLEVGAADAAARLDGGDEVPATAVDVDALAAGGGRPLGPWFLVAALLFLAVEVALGRRRPS